ncbi:MAG TPA: T9SS type A sorting domain-containing protein, partial [Bacteroidota bacterium]|nr:T9SS type A sorting domain-containing protein [Bacteroidota bacterium]
LFITHTYTLRKFADVDGNIGTSGDQTAKKWKMSLYKDSVSVASLVATGNPNNGVLSTANLESGTYIATEEDSLGWIHLGKIRHGTTTGNTTTSGNVNRDTVTFLAANPNSSDTLDFVNEQISTITIYKFKDTDGNPNTIESAKRWHLTLYKTSVSPGNIVAQADTSQLTVQGLPAGAYIASEADSGAGWVRLNGNHALNDTLVLLANQTVADTFINFRPNSILVRKRKDNDGNFATSADRVGKAWSLTVRDTFGVLVATVNDSTLSLPSLGDKSYDISEADSAGWIHLGYVINAVPVAGGANSVRVSLIDGQSAAVDFVNAPPIYSSFFRSFRQDSIANDVDNKGKIGKFVKRKADKDQFTALLVNDVSSVPHLHMEFSEAILTNYPFFTVPPSNHSPLDPSNKKWEFSFVDSVHHGDTVLVSGFGDKGKPQKVSKYFWEIVSGTPLGTKKKDPPFPVNQPKLPMPNRVNALFEAFEQSGFASTSGLIVGRDKTTPVDSSKKFYGWILASKYTDVLKSLKDKTGLHGGYARGFDKLTSNPTKAVLGRNKSIPPGKQNNKLIADMIALKLNITASMLAKIPIGFGELIYNDGTSNPYNGKMVKEIAGIGDSLMMGRYVGATHTFVDTSVFRVLDETIQKINYSFEGAMDTLDFSVKLHMKGTRRLEDVAYMHANPSVVPAVIIPLDRPIVETPQAYTLYQNYPNPFNPTTTIQFDLMEPSVVTLKIYNLLGQEVVTLLDHAAMEDGQQEVNFNAGNMASGVYFYRLITQPVIDPDEGVAGQQFVGVKKMMFIK